MIPTPILFYLAALGLFCLGAFFTRKTPGSKRVGGAKFERRRARRNLGQVLLFASVIPVALGVTRQVYPNNPVANESATTNGNGGKTLLGTFSYPSQQDVLFPGGTQSDEASRKIQQALVLLEQKQPDAAMAKVNAALEIAPNNAAAHALRGRIYAQRENWEEAVSDYQTALQFDDKNAQVRFDLAQIEFTQKKYDAARTAFFVLRQDPDLGDLATYKVFLCDLFGGHDDEAGRELAVFNQAGSNASYYFANAAWSLHLQKRADALGWLKSAQYIYPPEKFKLYADGLIQLVNSGTPGGP